MPGSKHRRRKKLSHSKNLTGSTGNAPREATPKLPTSGQILGVLVRSLGITHPNLGDKKAQRYFSGRLERRVKESSRDRIIAAVSETLAASIFVSTPIREDEECSDSSWLAAVLDWHAVNWDRFRAFLRPRMMRVYPDHWAQVWRAYVRLAAIDLALRAAAHVHIAGASPDALEFLEWTGVACRGEYLNRKRREAGVSLNVLAESIGVSDNTVAAWLYQGARPSDGNLAGIAGALASNANPDECKHLLGELRRLYWVGDVAGILGEFIRDEAVDEIIGRLRRYASLLCGIIDDKIEAAVRRDVLGSLATLGSQSEFSGALLAALISHEPDGEWKEDLKAAAGDWTRRVLAVNLGVHRAEEEDLIRRTEGRVLKDWDVSNPEAYAHYQRSTELQIQGRTDEAIAEVARAAELDPLDPANHFTLGSVKGGIGAKRGDAALVREGLEACWLAATLDQAWILPWAEIGFILLETGRPEEAVEHLLAAGPERAPLDTRYYCALGAALREMGRYEESLKAFESSLELDPDDPPVVAATAVTAALAGDKGKSNRYAKTARHMGASDELNLHLELAAAFKAAMPPPSEMGAGQGLGMPVLNASIRLDPTDAALYLQRARLHFLKEDDAGALSDLDQAVRLDPGNAGAYYIRGTVYGFFKQYDRVVSDMTEALRIGPKDASALYHRGLAHGELDELDLAIADLSEAIGLEPDNADAYRGRGDCRRYKAEYDLAVADYDAAIALDPGHAWSYRGRGAAFRMKGELDRAIADYDEAVRLGPKDFYALRFRGDAHLAKGDYDRVVADCEAAMSISGPDGVSYFYMANAHLFSGRLDHAIRAFDSAVECEPGSGRFIYGRALSRELSGDFEGAERDYRSARELGYEDIEVC